MATPQEAPSTPVEFDLLRPLRSAGAVENPFAIYSLLRTVRPVLRMPVPDYDGPGVWFLTGHEEVHAALRDPRFSADRVRAPLVRDNLERLPSFIQQSTEGMRSMLTMDAPDHTRLRKLVNKAFTPRRIQALRDRIEEIVDELLDVVAPAGRMDVITEFAAPLPAIVIAELLGVPAEDHPRFKAWAADIVQGVSEGTRAGGSRRATEAAGLLFAYLSEIIAARREDPRDDLISAMVLAQEERDALTDPELLATSNLLLLAGHETTTNLIGNGLLALLREPAELARLRADPSLLSMAIEELLRFDGPVQATVRVATEDIVLGDETIDEGSLVLIGIGAANHDPAVFEDPGRLDLARDPNPHVGFGFGAHFCLGAPLARLEGEIAFRALLDRFDEIELVHEAPRYRPNPILRGLTSLEVTLSSRASG